MSQKPVGENSWEEANAAKARAKEEALSVPPVTGDVV
jgi:hypothetical protein